MKFLVPLLVGLAAGSPSFAQATAPALKSSALAAYSAKSYRQAGQLYDQAFALPGTQAGAGDYYNAACSWALAGNAPNAFHDLDRAIEPG